jgi:DNA repair protein RecN (Recombination protein N)
MLSALSLRDFVIVDALNLDVKPGFTALTGETGAGKSILIDALQLVLGGRADADVVREGAERADIAAEFVPSARAKAWLEANDLQMGEENVLVRRTVDTTGRSRAWVNGIAVTASQLRALGETLVDVHGQHAHQLLLKPAYQLKLLDDHAGDADELAAVRAAHAAWQGAVRALEDATANADAIAEKAERLGWMIEDLQSLSPKKDEWQKLSEDHERLSHGVAIAEGLSQALGMVTEGEESASSALSAAHAKIVSLSRYDAKLADIAETLSSAIDLVDQTGREISHYLDRSDLDGERFAEIDARVSLYFDLARKFRTEPELLADLLEKSRAQLKALTGAKDVAALKRARDAARKAYDEAAARLTAVRSRTAKQLGDEVSEQMQRLAMKGARFEIALVPNPPSASGAEHCEFLIAGHAGVRTRPLAKVASGGELARISLAIDVVTVKAAPVPTLIFDEVDSGIGGATAEVVGMLLRQLGRERQVLCVTHLPQVAACADNHWKVEKHFTGGRTVSSLQVLSADARVEELARMLAGISISDNTRIVAREMLKGSAK